MNTRYTLFPIALLIASSCALAKESCGLQAAKLLAGGKTTELAALFTNPTELTAPLQQLAQSLGKVTDMHEESTAQFAQHKRISIQTKDIPATYPYQGYWISARSKKIGLLQIHIASAPDSVCRLLALHVDTPK
jgi:hypothetical protein